ncbi:hypothetical protein B6U90_01785 [Thermoplasmatales archaeon ex4484_6]|nr:MAG: hypothetical protein B6U90_01785 [Thermoplasmatales archaeon ex4484_6]
MSGIKIGNSGWSYRDWVGNFYPKGQRSSRFLSRYFTHFDTVEINTTFYDIPGRSMVEGWIKEASRFDGISLFHLQGRYQVPHEERTEGPSSGICPGKAEAGGRMRDDGRTAGGGRS